MISTGVVGEMYGYNSSSRPEPFDPDNTNPNDAGRESLHSKIIWVSIIMVQPSVISVMIVLLLAQMIFLLL